MTADEYMLTVGRMPEGRSAVCDVWRNRLAAFRPTRTVDEVERVRLLADYTGDQISLDKANGAVDQSATFIDAIQLAIASHKLGETPHAGSDTT